MKSSIRITNGGRTIHAKGAAARGLFEAITGTKLPPLDQPKPAASPVPSLDKCHGSEVKS